MDEYLHKYQKLSELVAGLPENVSAVRYISNFQAGIRNGAITAVPLGQSFAVGSVSYKDDLVRADPEFTTWHERTVRTLGLSKQRRGVAVHEEDVLSGEVNFDELAERYRQQLAGRASVKRPKKAAKRGKPRLTPTQPSDLVAVQPTPSEADEDRAPTLAGV